MEDGVPYGFSHIFGLVHAYLFEVQGTWQCVLICQMGYTIIISITLTSFHEPLSRTKHVGILSNDPIHVGKESSQHLIFKLLESSVVRSTTYCRLIRRGLKRLHFCKPKYSTVGFLA